jgi:hypothetical protein
MHCDSSYAVLFAAETELSAAPVRERQVPHLTSCGGPFLNQDGWIAADMEPRELFSLSAACQLAPCCLLEKEEKT